MESMKFTLNIDGTNNGGKFLENYIGQTVDIESLYKDIDITIDTAIIEKLCRKYHADWDFDESELSFGHSDESRNQIRSHMKNIIKDYMYEICLTR